MSDPYQAFGQDPGGLQTWADQRADALGIPRQPWPSLQWEVIEEYKTELDRQQAANTHLLDALQTASAVAAGAALASGAPDDAPIGELVGSDLLERLKRSIRRDLTGIYGEQYTSALRGWFDADDLDLLRFVFEVLLHEASESHPTSPLAGQLLNAIKGEWFDLLDEGSRNDICEDREAHLLKLAGWPVADEDEDEDADGEEADSEQAEGAVPGRASGWLPGRDTLMDEFPEVLREAVAVTVARLPFSCPEAWQLWQGAVTTIFLQLAPADDDETDEVAV